MSTGRPATGRVGVGAGRAGEDDSWYGVGVDMVAQDVERRQRSVRFKVMAKHDGVHPLDKSHALYEMNDAPGPRRARAGTSRRPARPRNHRARHAPQNTLRSVSKNLVGLGVAPVRREHQKVDVFSTDEPDHLVGYVSVREVGANPHIRGISLPKTSRSRRKDWSRRRPQCSDSGVLPSDSRSVG